jgi:hypothetical protein
MEHMRCIQNFGRKKQKGKDNLEDLGVDVMIILNGPWRNEIGSCGMDSSNSRQDPAADSYDHGNEPSGSTLGGDFLD